jgi:hypothetical protein
MAPQPAQQPLDASSEFVKAIIGSAVNIALPGAGSAVAWGYQALTAKSLNQELAQALSRAINVVSASANVGTFAFIKKAKGKWRKHQINKELKSSVTFSDLLGASVKKFDVVVEGDDMQGSALPAKSVAGESDEVTKEPEVRRVLVRSALAQFALARTPGPVPGTWQDDFDDHLERLARMGLEDPAHRDRWREMITGNKKKAPSQARVESWSRLVCEAFAVELASRPNLAPYRGQLAEHDKRASERAFLWQVDHQRRAINLVAFVLLAIAAEYGVHLVT